MRTSQVLMACTSAEEAKFYKSRGGSLLQSKATPAATIETPLEWLRLLLGWRWFLVSSMDWRALSAAIEGRLASLETLVELQPWRTIYDSHTRVCECCAFFWMRCLKMFAQSLPGPTS